MAGHIVKRTAKGRSPWYTIYIDGKDRHLGTDLAKAHAKAAALLKGESPTGPPATLRGLCLAWIAAGHPKWHVRRLGDWGEGKALQDVADLQGFADALTEDLKPASVRDYLRLARKCLAWGVRQGWPCVVPPMPKKLPKRVRSPRDISPATLVAALDRIRHAKLIVRFIVATGCRPGEACGLRWEDVDLRTCTAMPSKYKTKHHGKVRTLYLTPAAMDVLAEVATRTGIVFVNRKGNAYTSSGLRAILRGKGIPGAYCLRHTAAQSWLEQGTDYGVVAGLLGHTDLRTVQVYAQVRDHRLMDAAKHIKGLA